MIDKDINNLNPNFKAKLTLFLNEAKQKWFDIMIFEWRRTKERQQQLYNQWRTTPGKIVTWTLQSNHLTWNAVDIVFKDKNWNPSWNWNYDWLIEIAKKYWIRNLKPKETCHFEDDWTLFINNIIMWIYEELYKKENPNGWKILKDLPGSIKNCTNPDWSFNTSEWLNLIWVLVERIWRFINYK